MGSPASAPARIPDGEFEAALAEVTGCTAGNGALQRLLDDRRYDRDRDVARLETRCGTFSSPILREGKGGSLLRFEKEKANDRANAQTQLGLV